MENATRGDDPTEGGLYCRISPDRAPERASRSVGPVSVTVTVMSMAAGSVLAERKACVHKIDEASSFVKAG